MRALVCSEYGDAADMSLGELPEPEVRDDSVLIDVKCAGVAYVDALMVRNKHQNKHPLPFAPGMAVSGIVAGGAMQAGQRVMALVYDGGLADRASAPQAETFLIPDTMDYATAASLASGYLTPHAALTWEAQLAPGETLLVLGASGTVGSAAVDVGSAIGATVIAAASSQEKLALAGNRGASHAINYSTQDLYETVKSLTDGRGVDVVFDPVGGEHNEAAFRCLDWGGRYVVIGFAGGAIPQFPANRLLVKNRKAIGFVLMHYRKRLQAKLSETARALCSMVDEGTLSATPDQRVELSDAGKAIDDFFYRRASGTVVVDLND